jgi:hypothetical protein
MASHRHLIYLTFLFLNTNLRAEELDSGSVRSDYSFINGRSGRNGHEVNLTGLYRYFQRNQLEIGYSMLGKSYRGVPMRYDRMLRIGHGWSFHHRAYFYSNFEKNISRHYGPDWSVYGEPHYLPLENLDLGLGAQWKSYPINHNFSLRPVASYEIFDVLILSARSDIVLKTERAASGEGNIEYKIHPRFSLRAGGGRGKSDEGDGVLDDFRQFTTQANFKLLDTLQIHANFQLYRGDLRKENRYGGGMNYYF